MTRINAPWQQPKEIHYPESDGKPMADNTKQFNYITRIKENLEIVFKNKDVFVAGDLLWYPVKGDPKIATAPDVLVVYGRPKGDRGSYKQWMEGDVPPQVVFEVLSPSNTRKEMLSKLAFYNRYGVEEYIVIDPLKNRFQVYLRQQQKLEKIKVVEHTWHSERMNITIEAISSEVRFYYPDGKLFLNLKELDELLQLALKEKEKAVESEARALADKKRAVESETRALAEKKRAVESEARVLAEKEQERIAKEQALLELAALKAELERLKR